MRIDRAISTWGGNLNYLPSWPIAARAWKDIIGVHPTLFMFHHDNDRVPLDSDGDIIRLYYNMHKWNGIHSVFASQCARMLFACLYPDEFVITTDLDMMPVSHDYFQSSIIDIPDNHFVTYRQLSCVGKGQVPMCYNVAKGSTWREIFGIETMRDAINRLHEWYDPSKYNQMSHKNKGGLGWYTDQILLFKYLKKFDQSRWTILNDKDTGYYRMDRVKSGDPNHRHISKSPRLSDFKGASDFHLPIPTPENYIDENAFKPFSNQKKVISFSLYNNKPKLHQAALVNIEEAKRIYPDWIYRFYTTDNEDICNKLREAGAEVIRMDHWPRGKPFWRFLAMDDSDITIFRDVDSVVNVREKAAVDEWMSSRFKYHRMRENKHTKHIVLAGMWGIKGSFAGEEGAITHMQRWLSEEGAKNPKMVPDRYGTDQVFLNTYLFPMMQGNLMSHGVGPKQETESEKRFPYHVKMKYGSFVGEVIFRHMRPGDSPKSGRVDA